jgi:fission process protein 1
MWPWSSGSDKPTGSTPQDNTTKPAQTTSATDDLKKAVTDFDPKKLPEREKLPKKLQKIIDKSDKEENFFDELVEG